MKTFDIFTGALFAWVGLRWFGEDLSAPAGPLLYTLAPLALAVAEAAGAIIAWRIARALWRAFREDYRRARPRREPVADAPRITLGSR